MIKQLKKELKHNLKEKKRCQKLYNDWVDNEFNMGPLKFIFAVTSNTNNYLNNIKDQLPSFNTLNDLLIYYNRDTKKYLLNIEIGYNKKDESDIDYLFRLNHEFQVFMDQQGKSVNLFGNLDSKLFNFINNDMDYWIADTLEELYYKFYVFVSGYYQMLKDAYLI